MGKPLFDNVGKEIKRIAEIVAKWIMIRHIIIGLLVAVVGIALGVELDSGVIGFASVAVAILVIAHGSIESKLRVIMLYADGEAVDMLKSIDGKMGKKHSEVGSKTKGKVKVKEVSVDMPTVERNTDGSWNCLFCDHRNPAGADWCEECGCQAQF